MLTEQSLPRQPPAATGNAACHAQCLRERHTAQPVQSEVWHACHFGRLRAQPVTAFFPYRPSWGHWMDGSPSHAFFTEEPRLFQG